MQSPNPDRSKKSICAICHEQGGGCCRLGADSVERMFGLTLGEVEIIAKASNTEPEAFVKADRVSPGFLEDLASIHPVFPQTLPQGRRLRLAVTAEGSCVFFGAQGLRTALGGAAPLLPPLSLLVHPGAVRLWC